MIHIPVLGLEYGRVYGGFHKKGAPQKKSKDNGPYYRDYQNGAPNLWKQPYGKRTMASKDGPLSRALT